MKLGVKVTDVTARGDEFFPSMLLPYHHHYPEWSGLCFWCSGGIPNPRSQTRSLRHPPQWFCMTLGELLESWQDVPEWLYFFGAYLGLFRTSVRCLLTPVCCLY